MEFVVTNNLAAEWGKTYRELTSIWRIKLPEAPVLHFVGFLVFSKHDYFFSCHKYEMSQFSMKRTCLTLFSFLFNAFCFSDELYFECIGALISKIYKQIIFCSDPCRLLVIRCVRIGFLKDIVISCTKSSWTTFPNIPLTYIIRQEIELNQHGKLFIL